MYTTITIVSYIFILSLVFVGGYVLSYLLRRNKTYSGTIKVIRKPEGVLYSLELHEDPVMLEYMNEVVFKVENSDES